MARAAIRLVMAMSRLWFAGCGSFFNYWSLCEGTHKNGGRPYGGVANSLKMAKLAADNVADPQEDIGPGKSAMIGLYFLTIDAPLSLAVDTATLPMFGLAALLELTEKAKAPKAKPDQETTLPVATSESSDPLLAPAADSLPRSTPQSPARTGP